MDNMSTPDVQQRPAKRRRFFVDDPPSPKQPIIISEKRNIADVPPSTHTREPSSDVAPATSSQTDVSVQDAVHTSASTSVEDFDEKLFKAVVGDAISKDSMDKLREISGNNTERAINMFLDGSWQTTMNGSISDHTNGSVPHRQKSVVKLRSPPASDNSASGSNIRLLSMANTRYVGAFGVGGWATRSGSLIKHGETVKIERTKGKVPTKIRRDKQRADVIVRFTNRKGDEIGRLPKETATWVSSLIDQKVCHFEGTCVYAPERLRINDTIYLQLRCFLLKKTFESGGLIKPVDNNRKTGIFEEKETSEEQDLRLRQVALVKLFDEINLLPTTRNEVTERHKRQGLLQAAEIAEQYENKGTKEKKPKTSESGTSTPPEDDEPEEGKELEQDQLDSLYKKAQSFDFNMPTQEPADTFIMNLRKYQKQALYWMMKKEKDEKTDGNELSMHPLWEEYTWPIKDVDDKDLPMVADQDCFYINPYSGELSLEFPVQEQHCLGGILADGKSNTVE